MKGITWKIICLAILSYALIYGLTASLPELPGQEQSSRNLFYHVPMWITVIALMGISVWNSVKFLRYTDPDFTPPENPLLVDARAVEAARVGVVFILLGFITGTIWSRVAWKAHILEDSLAIFWTNDPILICALVSLLVYLAYFLLRSSFSEMEQRGKISAAYNIFAFATLIPLYFVIPSLLPGLHPTAEGSESGAGTSLMKVEGIDMTYRAILYPSMIGFVMLGIWMYQLRSKLQQLYIRLDDVLAEKLYKEEN